MHTYFRTGLRHLASGIGCQDAIYSREEGDLRFFAIADGASACENSRLGAETACRAAADYYLRYHATLDDCSDEKIAWLILDQVRFSLEELAAEKKIPAGSLSSTLTFCCVNTQTLEMLAFQLGDGAVYLADRCAAHQSVAPCCCRTAPPLTMTRNAYKAVQIRRFSLTPGTQILLCTDGLLKLLSGSRGEEIRLCLDQRNWDGLCDILDEAESQDDCSFIASGPIIR